MAAPDSREVRRGVLPRAVVRAVGRDREPGRLGGRPGGARRRLVARRHVHVAAPLDRLQPGRRRHLDHRLDRQRAQRHGAQTGADHTANLAG